jgi:uncharacterized membrane protein (DUF2068 family)
METPPAQAIEQSPKPHSHRSRKVLVLIGLFKLLHASLMLVLAIVALCFTRDIVTNPIRIWAEELNVGPSRRIIGDFLLNKVLRINHHVLWGVAAGAGFYAALFATEGIGLLMDKLWAEWLAVIATASLIPLELMETLHRHSWQRAVGMGTIVVNVAIVVYLARQVMARIRESKGH